MTTKELRDRVRVTKCGCGQYEVRIEHRGKTYRGLNEYAEELFNEYLGEL